MPAIGGRGRSVPLFLATALATAGLYVVSRGKWSDPIIDSGREWIVPDALARGQLLYRDVVYWFGPFTPYFHAAFFRAFGSGLATLVLAGAAGSLGVLGALFCALRRVTARTEAALWTALAVPTLLFMPNAGGSLLGMGYRIWHASAFALLSIAVASRPSRRSPGPRLAAAGSLAALAGLCRTEWGLVSLLAVLFCRGLGARSVKRLFGEAVPAAAAFLGVSGGVIAFFVARAGAGAVLTDGHVLLTGLPEETRTFFVAFSGIRDWRSGLAQLFYSAGMWLGAFLVLELIVAGRQDRARMGRGVVRLLALLVLLALLAALGGASGAVLFSAAPLVCLATLVTGLLRGREPRAAAAAAFGLTGLLLSYRRPFHIGDSAYVGPPLLFAFVCSAALLRLAVVRARPRESRIRLQAALGAGLATLTVFSFTGRALQYASDDRIPIPGTDGMLSARPSLAREIASLASSIRRQTAPGEGLAAFPEGEILNLLSGRPNPIRHKLYIPGYLTEQNEAEILRELERSRPGAVVIWQRPTSEYGRGFFGVDYGRLIRAWVNEKYAVSVSSRRGERNIFLAVRRGS